MCSYLVTKALSVWSLAWEHWLRPLIFSTGMLWAVDHGRTVCWHLNPSAQLKLALFALTGDRASERQNSIKWQHLAQVYAWLHSVLFVFLWLPLHFFWSVKQGALQQQQCDTRDPSLMCCLCTIVAYDPWKNGAACVRQDRCGSRAFILWIDFKCIKAHW